MIYRVLLGLQEQELWNAFSTRDTSLVIPCTNQPAGGAITFSEAHELNQHSRLDKNFPYLTFAILLLFGLIQITWGERIPINDGLGWDGPIYARAAQEFPENFFRKPPSAFELQKAIIRIVAQERLFPSAVVNLGLRVLGLERTNKNIIKGFEIYNLTLLLISSIILSLLTNELRLSGRSKWLGFCFLFINFPVLKFNFYYPVLTDTTAFTLGCGLAYCFLKRNSLGMLLLLIIGSFTWPTFLYSGILLYFFPNTNSGTQPPTTPARYRLNIAVAIAACVGVLVAIIYLHYGRKIQFPNGADQVNESLLIISLLVVAAYIFTSLTRLLDFDYLFNPKAILGALAPRRLILSASVLLIIKLITAALVSGVRGRYDYTLLNSIAKPAIFLIAHVVYFGPVVLFFLYYFKSLYRIIHRHGIGLTLYFVFCLLWALDSESRHLINAFPFMVILVTMFMDTLSWKGWQGWVILALCLLFSKVWLPINSQGLTGDYLAFPFQYYFMNHGPWMSSLSYVIQTIFVISTAGFLYLVFFRRVWTSNSVLSGSPVTRSNSR